MGFVATSCKKVLALRSFSEGVEMGGFEPPSKDIFAELSTSVVSKETGLLRLI